MAGGGGQEASSIRLDSRIRDDSEDAVEVNEGSHSRASCPAFFHVHLQFPAPAITPVPFAVELVVLQLQLVALQLQLVVLQLLYIVLHSELAPPALVPSIYAGFHSK